MKKGLLVVVALTVVLGTWWVVKEYVEEHHTTGTIIEVWWDCWSCNDIYGLHSRTQTGDMDRRTAGDGRVADCFTIGNPNIGRNNVQSATFHIVLDTPLGKKTARYRWNRHHSDTREFKMPIELPTGATMTISTTKSGFDAWIE